MRNKNNLFFVISLILTIGLAHAQDDLLETVEEEFLNQSLNTQATFKSTRISIAHSVETRKTGILELHAMNRFWNTPEPRTQNFVADRMSTRIALEYGITDKLMFGVGGTTWDGIFDSFLKYRLTHQKINDNNFPLSITLFQNISYNSEATNDVNAFNNFNNRLSFTSQILLARKITSKFSFQISPTFVHRNSVLVKDNPKNQFAIGFGGRYKLGHHVSIVSEYYYVLNPLESINTFNAFALGVNWELGDIILQFQLTNARAMTEDAFITQTRTNFNFNDGNFHFGFHATYVFHLNRHQL